MLQQFINKLLGKTTTPPQDAKRVGVIYNHDKENDFASPATSGRFYEEIEEHITKYIGKPRDTVMHEIVSDQVHIDLLIIDPTEKFDFYTLVTVGMSDKPMTVPKELGKDYENAELLLFLPKEWPIEGEAWKNEDNYWPIRWLKALARFPHSYNTWLGYGHTVPNGNPPQPFSKNTEMSNFMVTFPYHLPGQIAKLQTKSGDTVNFYAILPLYKSECDYKIANGADTLEDLFQENPLIINPARVKVA